MMISQISLILCGGQLEIESTALNKPQIAKRFVDVVVETSAYSGELALYLVLCKTSATAPTKPLATHSGNHSV